MIPRPASLASAQAVMFFGPGTKVQGSRLLRLLPESMLERFDGDPVLPPNPGSVQLSIPGFSFPAILLNRRDGNVQMSISDQRADVTSPAGQLDDSLDAFFATACESLLTVRGLLSANVPRVAAVVHRYRAFPNPARALADQFCREGLVQSGPLNRPENFELHAHKIFRTAFGAQVNSWVRNRTGVVTATNTPVVSVEQDMNTIPAEDGSALTDASVSMFFRGITAELDRALLLYYPNPSTDL